MIASRFGSLALLFLMGTAICSAEGEERPRMSLLPLPCVFSTPETGLGGGALLMAIVDLYPDHPGQTPDNYRMAGIYTIKKQSSFALQAEHYSPGMGLKAEANAFFSLYPATYYGIGGPEDGVEEDYSSLNWNADARLGFELAPALYLGPSLRWSSYSIKERQAGGILERGNIEGSRGAGAILIGPRLTYEGRDSALAAARGYYADFSFAYGPEFLGADSAFSLSTLDLRGYAEPFRDFGAVIAAQLFAATAFGSPPFQELPKMGGDGRLRGYLDAEYLDKTVALAQLELRSPTLWRFGFTLFGGVGLIGRDSGSLDFEEPHFARGMGLRFLLDQKSRAKLRMDIAWGEGEMQVYFQFGEAF
jgi:outer membrane protein assembly factor BamA